jgi:hypothetical protein
LPEDSVLARSSSSPTSGPQEVLATTLGGNVGKS